MEIAISFPTFWQPWAAQREIKAGRQRRFRLTFFGNQILLLQHSTNSELSGLWIISKSLKWKISLKLKPFLPLTKIFFVFCRCCWTEQSRIRKFWSHDAVCQDAWWMISKPFPDLFQRRFCLKLSRCRTGVEATRAETQQLEDSHRFDRNLP